MTLIESIENVIKAVDSKFVVITQLANKLDEDSPPRDLPSCLTALQRVGDLQTSLISLTCLLVSAKSRFSQVNVNEVGKSVAGMVRNASQDCSKKLDEIKNLTFMVNEHSRVIRDLKEYFVSQENSEKSIEQE